MTSKNPGVSEGELIKLIYLHLKENGHKKAASVLRKHAPQVETTSVNVSLNELVKKWMSENDSEGRPAGEEQILGSSKGSVSKAKKPRNAKKPSSSKHNISPTSRKKIQMTAGSTNQKKKRTKKKEDRLSDPMKAQTDLTSKSSTAGDDSDSDSSLDVEKWKRLAFELSDADIAKMDALAPPSSTGKRRKTTQPKKETSKNINGKPSAKKTKTKAAISPSKTKKTDKPSKPRTKKTTSTVTTHNVKTPSKKTKDKGNLSETEISCSLSEEAAIPKTDGISENDCIKPKKKKNKKAENMSESNNPETVSQSLGTKKPDDPVEIKQVKTHSKKAKANVNKSLEPVIVHTPSIGASIEISSIPLSTKKSKKTKDLPNSKPVKDNIKKATKAADLDTSEQVDTEAVSSSGNVVDQSEKNNELSDSSLVKAPSKKAKSKINQSLVRENEDTPSLAANPEVTTKALTNSYPVETSVKKVKLSKSVKAVESVDLYSPLTQANTESVSVDQSEKNDKTPFKKAKSKKSANPIEPGELNTPSAEANANLTSRHTSSDQSEALSKVDQEKASGEKTPSKKTKSKKVKEPSQPAECNTPSGEGDAEEGTSPSKFDQLQSPSNKPVTQKAELNIVAPSTIEKLSKKSKAKKTDCISELCVTETPSKKKVTHTGHPHSEEVTSEVTLSKTPKHTANNLPEALISETPVKKSKTKKPRSPELNQATAASNEASLDAGEADTQRSTKKSKSKKLDNVVQSDETHSVLDTSLSTIQNAASEEIDCPSSQNQHKEKKRKNKDKDTVNVSFLEEAPEPKKRKKDKKRKKENDESAVEDVPTALQAEEIEVSLMSDPVKKKKKKKKDKDVEKSVLSSPVSEEEPPKKKKKSSKGKEHISDVAQEGHI